jgi:hypothetical protein
MLTVADNTAGSLSGIVNATAGAGGNSTGAGGNGGNATAYIALTSALNGVNVSSTATAAGGAGGVGSQQGSAGTSNAMASASAIGSGVASANSTAVGTGAGAAVATSTSSGPSGQSIVASATSPVGGPASALTQTTFGGALSLPNAINPGQSFSVISAFSGGPSTLGLGSMGAGYGGAGQSLTYVESANFMFNAAGGTLLIDLLNNASLGKGFDSAAFQISLNGNVVYNQSFIDLAFAQAFFSNDLLNIQLANGLNDVSLTFDETMSSYGGFSFDYGVAGVSAAPLPPSWTMMLIGLAGLGFVAYRRQKQNAAFAA